MAETNEVLRTTYTWSDFDLQAALAGTVVGFPDNNNDSENIGKKTGKLRRNMTNVYTKYVVTINGNTCYINEDGVVAFCANSTYKDKVLKMCEARLVSTAGSQQQTTRSAGEEYKSTLALSSLEVRDTFAVYAMQSLIRHCEDNPIYYDDANILSVCAASYRWAQGMMQAAADARALVTVSDGGSDDSGGGSSGGTTRSAVDVTDGTTTEKLLSNLVSAVDSLTTETKKLTTVKVDNVTGEDGKAKEFKTSGSGGGASLNRDDVNDTGENITDVIVYNSAVGKAPLRATIANFGKKLLSTLSLSWLTKKGETSISDASTFFTQYKDEMATALAEKFDAKGAADTAESNAKKYADDNFEKKS